jgi:hypothetical protein
LLEFFLVLVEQFVHLSLDGLELLFDLVDTDVVLFALIDSLKDLWN